MGRTRDLRCVICGKRPDETGSAKKFVKAARGRWAMVHLDCYGKGDAEIQWVDWILARVCKLTPDKPSSDCPNYLAEVARDIEKARDGRHMSQECPFCNQSDRVSLYVGPYEATFTSPNRLIHLPDIERYLCERCGGERFFTAEQSKELSRRMRKVTRRDAT